MKIKVLISGAAGKMGRETVKAVAAESDLILVGAVDLSETGKDVGTLVGIKSVGIEITNNLVKTIKQTKPDVVVDFTNPTTVLANVKAILTNGAAAIIGTTGLSPENIAEIKTLTAKTGKSAIVAPNFAIGAILMMKFVKEAAKYMPEMEIIELHHDNKADAPSGTAIKTAELITEAIEKVQRPAIKETEKLKGARGANLNGVHIHSIRLRGMVAHQEVIFGGVGQTLSIRHDSLNRESFMPGVVMAIRKIKKVKGLVYGLETLI
jgi:4-hydroxy-tetrahydrodipicolinate reductase